jgi:hypothetical protein
MNIFEKLQTARVRLAATELKKSGKYSGYKYFELSDFLPETQRLFNELKLCGVVTFDRENARLQIFDSEKPDLTITFTSPMAEANLKGNHPIQNMGAVQTYQRRYLYMAALEITEPDAVDGRHEEETKTTPQVTKPTAKIQMTTDAWSKLVDRIVNKGEDLEMKIRATYILTPEQDEFLLTNKPTQS